MRIKILPMIILLVLYFLAASFSISQAAGSVGILSVANLPHSDPLYNKYPLIGASEYSSYYLDTSSCYAETDGNIAVLSCIVLNTNGRNLSGDRAATLNSTTYIFKTYKKKNKRKIILENAADKNGIVYWNNLDANKDDYLYALFWRIAGVSGINHFLD